MPTISNRYTYESSSNELAASLPVNGAGEFAAGNLVIVFVTLDADHKDDLQIGDTGFTTAWLEENGISNGITHACYYKTLTAGDITKTSIDFSWSGSDKACIAAYLITDHSGIDGTPAFNENGTSTSGELPAITYGAGTLSFASCGLDANTDVSVLPAGYTTELDHNATGSGNCSQWIGIANLSGAQSANVLTLSSPRGNIQGIIGVAAAVVASDVGYMIGAPALEAGMQGKYSIEPAMKGSQSVTPAMKGVASIE